MEYSMILIHTQLIGKPETLVDERGEWRSAINRTPVVGPVELHARGLAGDQVADTVHHGSRDQAVCCHPIVHYHYWNKFYALDIPQKMLGPGSVGENWTLTNASEEEVCVGDIFSVGSARVQVSGPRIPCSKQERKVKLPGFHHYTLATLRTGFYLRVLVPGSVQAGVELALEERLHPELTLHRINVCGLHTFDSIFARQILDIPELSAGWKKVLFRKFEKLA
jgi:MOSC domain-containing protein YiiM